MQQITTKSMLNDKLLETSQQRNGDNKMRFQGISFVKKVFLICWNFKNPFEEASQSPDTETPEFHPIKNDDSENLNGALYTEIEAKETDYQIQVHGEIRTEKEWMRDEYLVTLVLTTGNQRLKG